MKHGASKSSLFLLELVLMIGLFALSAAVCLQVFAYAQTTAQQAEDLSQATLVAQSGAACYQTTWGDFDAMATLLEGQVDQQSVTVAYDDQWQPTQQQGTYTMRITAQAGEATIAVARGQTPIYTLAVRIPGGGAE